MIDSIPVTIATTFANSTNEFHSAPMPIHMERQRKPLTDEEIEKIAKQNDAWMLFRSLTIFDFVRAIEAAHGIK